MAKTHWILLLATCGVSAASVIVFIVSFLTTQWIVAEAQNPAAMNNSRIEYGLFGGHMTRHLLASESHYRLHVHCSDAADATDAGAGASICMYSCQQTAEQRQYELAALLAGRPLRECAAVAGARSFMRRATATTATTAMTRAASRLETEALPAGFWVATVAFLSLGTVLAMVATGFGALNVFYSPVQPIWGIMGLHIWNGCAASCAALTLILWGAAFAGNLSRNVAVTDTLVAGNGAYVSDGFAALGYSYWILLAPVAMHALNSGLLVWRKRLIEAEPTPPAFVEAKQELDIWF